MSDVDVDLIQIGAKAWYRDGDVYRPIPYDTEINWDSTRGLWLKFPEYTYSYVRYPNGKNLNGCMVHVDPSRLSERTNKLTLPLEGASADSVTTSMPGKLTHTDFPGLDVPGCGMRYVVPKPEEWGKGKRLHYVVHDPFRVGFDFYTDDHGEGLYTDGGEVSDSLSSWLPAPPMPRDPQKAKHMLYRMYCKLISDWNNKRYNPYLDNPLVTGISEEDDVRHMLRCYPETPEATNEWC